MASCAVGQREGHLVVTPAAPFALNDSNHTHVVLSGGGYEYFRVTYLAFKPPGVYLMRVTYVIYVVALGLDDYVHLQRRELVFAFVKGVFGFN